MLCIISKVSVFDHTKALITRCTPSETSRRMKNWEVQTAEPAHEVGGHTAQQHHRLSDTITALDSFCAQTSVLLCEGESILLSQLVSLCSSVKELGLFCLL